MQQSKVKKIVYIALFSAMAYVLARFTKFSIFPNAAFLKLDFGEVPLLMLGALASPSCALIALGVKEMLSLTLSGSNIFGLIADFTVCGSFLFVFFFASKQKFSMKRSIGGFSVATFARAIVCIPVNYAILYLQFGTNAAGVTAQLPYIIPFNLFKCLLDATCFLLLYPRVGKQRSAQTIL